MFLRKYLTQAAYRKMSQRASNRLSKEKSPYLLQHQYNPVDWHPWGKEAIDKATQLNKPIFVSIGYSTCHWCHVMEHETFEDEQVAALLNEYFVNVKVDRQERPDIDAQYMHFVQASTGSGGWPLNVFLTPQLKPFFGGTYFAPDDRYNRPSFTNIIEKIHSEWEYNPTNIFEVSEEIEKDLQKSVKLPASEALNVNLKFKLYSYLKRTFDAQNGGFSIQKDAPKFPNCPKLEFLLAYYKYLNGLDIKQPDLKSLQLELDISSPAPVSAEDAENNVRNSINETKTGSLQMLNVTLEKIAAGGIHDHVGNGFHRYSVDPKFQVPHFEKMLYDQAQILDVLCKMYSISKQEEYKKHAIDLLEYVSLNLLSEKGYFCCAEDADSLELHGTTKKEGAYYVWEYSEVKEALGNDFQIFKEIFHVEKLGNVASQYDPHGELTGKNILRMHENVNEVALKHHISSAEMNSIIDSSLRKLLEVRKHRPKPHLDDQPITSLNALMISALCTAKNIVGADRALEMAIQSINFILENFNKDAKLQRTYSIDGFCDDYSFFIRALLDLYGTLFDGKYLKMAIRLQEKQDELFWDEDGYATTSKLEPAYLAIKDYQDNDTPSINSISAMNLFRLHSLTGNPKYQIKLQILIKSLSAILNNFPYAMPLLVNTLIFDQITAQQVIISGECDSSILNYLVSEYNPNRVILHLNESTKEALTETENTFLLQKFPEGLKISVCQKFACHSSVETLEQLKSILEIS